MSAILAALVMLSLLPLPASAKVGQTYKSRVQGLRVHKAPSGDSEIIFKISQKQTVIHKATVKGWWKIKTADGKEGYVYRTYLKAAGNPIKKNAIYKVYKITNLTVRKAPRSIADKLGSIRRGTQVKLQNRRGDWGFVKLANGKGGWVQLKYLNYVRG
ncbi:SH3 domain-containing protein [Bacillota bacterium Meth-B3]|nr:SH3 domain-containing protein [Christensenellaceae bacterium]MEA5065773.1 SH3 domain-containing protein [Eubacteriales bacterium]MEA5070167.1 SH3 domain-containing protein [Christensenellaceae bacterium]